MNKKHNYTPNCSEEEKQRIFAEMKKKQAQKEEPAPVKASSLCEKKTPTEIFAAMLDVIEFELVKHEDGYGLVDLQGANLGDIESDRFQTAAQIIDRLDIYINDYYLNDLDEEFCNTVEANGFEVTENMKHSTAEEWCDFAKFPHSCKGVEKFVEDHKHEFDVLDMIVNHADEVKLDEITAWNE